MVTSIIIDSKDQSGKTVSKSLTYVNPQAPDAQLYQMAVYFNAISTNTFDTVSRVDKRKLSSEVVNNG